MESQEYEAMFRVEDDLWWYVGMRDIVRAFVSGRQSTSKSWTLDAGCGTGGNLQSLSKYGEVVGLDFSQEALAFAGERGPWPLLRGTVNRLPFRDNAFAFLSSFDVICHRSVGDDEAAIREFCRVLQPGGRLLLRLPAYNWLYSQHDVAVHTKRRYTAGELDRMVKAAGMNVSRISYANAALFPIAAARRLVLRGGHAEDGSDVRPVAPLLNSIFSKVLSSESSVIQRTGLPFGLTVMVLAQKPF